MSKPLLIGWLTLALPRKVGISVQHLIHRTVTKNTASAVRHHDTCDKCRRNSPVSFTVEPEEARPSWCPFRSPLKRGWWERDYGSI